MLHRDDLKSEKFGANFFHGLFLVRVSCISGEGSGNFSSIALYLRRTGNSWISSMTIFRTCFVYVHLMSSTVISSYVWPELIQTNDILLPPRNEHVTWKATISKATRFSGGDLAHRVNTPLIHQANMINQGCNKICEVSPPDLINIDCMHLSILKNVNSWTCGEQMMCLEVTVFGPNPPPTMYHGMPWSFSVFRYSPYKICFFYKAYGVSKQRRTWQIGTGSGMKFVQFFGARPLNILLCC